MASLMIVDPSGSTAPLLRRMIEAEGRLGVLHTVSWHVSWMEILVEMPATPDPLVLFTPDAVRRGERNQLASVLCEYPEIDLLLLRMVEGTPFEGGGCSLEHWPAPTDACGVVNLGHGICETQSRQDLIENLGIRFTRRFRREIRRQDRQAGVYADLILGVAIGESPRSVAGWARTWGMSERSLRRKVGRQACATPRTLNRLASLYLAARMRAYRDRSLSTVAHLAGFSHPSNLCRSIRRHLLADPEEIQGFSGLRLVRTQIIKLLGLTPGESMVG